MDRYRKFLASAGLTGPIADPETWYDGGIEFTEAVLRSAGFNHGDKLETEETA
jgi:hypothetical protein